MSTPEAEAWKKRERERSGPKKPGYNAPHHVIQQIKRQERHRVHTKDYFVARRNEAEERDRLYETVLHDNDLLNYHTSYVYACLSVLLIIKYYDKQSRDGGRGKSICSEYGEGERLAAFINKQLSVYPDKDVLSLFGESRSGNTKVYKLNYRNLFPKGLQPPNLNMSINPGIYKKEGDERLYRGATLDIPPATWTHFVYYMKRVRFYRIAGVYGGSLFMNSLEGGELYPFVINDTVLDILSKWSFLRLYDYVQRMLVSRDRADKLQIKYPSDYGKEDKPTTSAAPSSSSAAASYPSYSLPVASSAAVRSEEEEARNFREGLEERFKREAAAEAASAAAAPKSSSGWFSSFFGGRTRKQAKSKRRSHRKKTYRKSKHAQ